MPITGWLSSNGGAEASAHVPPSSADIVHEGWLVKAPPPSLKRHEKIMTNFNIKPKKWRRRFFVLRPSVGSVPGQYVLDYYTNKDYKKLKGQIDLTECKQVDRGLPLEGKREFLFTVCTPKRNFVLAADSEEEMNRWVELLCQLCGLLVANNNQPHSRNEYESPYIPISECISGGPERPRNPKPTPPPSSSSPANATVFRYDDEAIRFVARHGPTPPVVDRNLKPRSANGTFSPPSIDRSVKPDRRQVDRK